MVLFLKQRKYCGFVNTAVLIPQFLVIAKQLIVINTMVFWKTAVFFKYFKNTLLSNRAYIFAVDINILHGPIHRTNKSNNSSVDDKSSSIIIHPITKIIGEPLAGQQAVGKRSCRHHQGLYHLRTRIKPNLNPASTSTGHTTPVRPLSFSQT